MLGLVSGYLRSRQQMRIRRENFCQTLDFDDDDHVKFIDHDDPPQQYIDDKYEGGISVLELLRSVIGSTDRKSPSYVGEVDTRNESFEPMVEPIYLTLTCPVTGDTYEGPVADGTKHGNGAVFRKLDGTKFLGSYRNNKPYEGTLVTPTFTYTGRLDHKGKFHGSWGILVEGGREYSGEFRHGFFDGVGKEVIEEEQDEGFRKVKAVLVYTGHFRRGLRHGLGTLVVRHLPELPSSDDQGPQTSCNTDVTADGSIIVYSYSGMWFDGLKEGEGTELLPFETFKGSFLRNKRHGEGTLTSRNGTSKKGAWRAGKPVDGPGWTISFPDGSIYHGETRQFQAHGRGSMHYAPSPTSQGSSANACSPQTGTVAKIGTVYTGEFRNGARHGRGLCIYSSGEEFDGLWGDDEPKSVSDVNKQSPPQRKGSIGAIMFNENGAAPDSENASDNEVKSSKRRSGSYHSNVRKSGPDDVSRASEYLYPNGDVFLGNLDENGLRQGRGIYIGAASGCRYEGDFVDGKRQGRGVLITAFTKYIGEFFSDKKSGEGTLIYNDVSTYKGRFRDGMFHGHGALCDCDGSAYTGEWQFGLQHGAGEECLPDGTVFRGEFKEGKRSGVGTLLNKYGDVEYSGTWFDGLMEGEGTLYTPSSPPTNPSDDGEERRRDEYRGTFVRGKRCGQGKLTTPDGLMLRGKWLRDNPLDGEWTVCYPDGSAFSGYATCKPCATETSLTMPVPNGFGTMKYKNGDVYSGNLIDGRREGRGVCVFANGDRWDGTWVRDAVDVDGTGVLTLADGTEHRFGSVVDGLVYFD